MFCVRLSIRRIRIIAKGASGGTAPGNNGAVGHGARIRAVFSLHAGSRIHLLVGQEGGTEVSCASCVIPAGRTWPPLIIVRSDRIEFLSSDYVTR